MESHKVGRLVLLRCEEAAHATHLVDRLQATFKQGKTIEKTINNCVFMTIFGYISCIVIFFANLVYIILELV